jgi:hypothetical protein
VGLSRPCWLSMFFMYMRLIQKGATFDLGCLQAEAARALPISRQVRGMQNTWYIVVCEGLVDERRIERTGCSV